MVYYLTVVRRGCLLFGAIHAAAAGAARLDSLIVFMYTAANYAKQVGAVVKLCRIKVLNV